MNFFIATADLGLQTAAYAGLLAMFYFAKKKDLEKHGKIAIVPVTITMISIIFAMVPTFLEITSAVPSSDSLVLFATLHHLIGLTAFLMAVLLLIKPCAWVGAKFGNLRNYMLALFLLWSLAYLGGVALYLTIYKPFG